ncbi:MAG TPA: flap endonuclease-1 [Methanobacterium sp.]
MGVKFKDIINPEPIKFEDLKGKTVAIDAANIIYQFLSIIRQADGTPLMDHRGKVTSHFSGILYRTTSLIEKEIKPFYVFDGVPSALKKSTQLKRSEVKEESRKKWKDALENGNIEEARKYAGRTSRMSTEIVEGSKKLLELMGIPYIQAKGEGEAQASYMVDRGDAWCVGSQDYDCMLFGATRMVKNLTITGGKANLELIQLERVLENLKITREQLVDVAILVGTDFNEGIKGIGAKKGINLIKKHGDVFKVLDEMKLELEVDPNQVRELFFKHDFISDYELKWREPDREGTIEFLAGEHDFSEERVANALNKLKKLDSGQSSLEKWF